MHTSSNELAAQAERIRDSFILPNVQLPERINREDIVFVGFADECCVRQSPVFFDIFLDFLQKEGDASFFFLWFEAPPSVTDASCGFSLYSTIDCERPTNFVRLQKDVPDEVLSGSMWFISSLSGQWAIYGEQYESELAVFLARDYKAAENLHLAFRPVLVGAVDAAKDLGDPSETDEGETFISRLVHNYRA